MLRYRRYRVFVVFAVIAVIALYKFGSSGTSWSQDGSRPASKGENSPHLNWQPRPPVVQDTKPLEIDVPAAKTSQALQTPPPVTPVEPPAEKKPAELSPSSQTPASTPIQAAAAGTEADNKIQTVSPEDTPLEKGEGRLEVTAVPTSSEAIHWKKQSEHFPVPSQSIIKTPAQTSKPIPKVQFEFKQESAASKADRLAKLDVIKSVFKRSWDGYREYAWLQDELSPVSNGSRNPFAGWGATLVDALDTLWIMGMKEEFEEAVKAVDKIDFTTTTRADIPLFETTIRYLGGFLAAYDLSEKKYKNLLEKAVELAEILISAFDTPNRMPQTYYYWRPTFSSQPHRASNRVVLAEIGSLSMEFTRLAQLTGEHKYYDAIARITDALEEFQNNTRLPGMWPTYLDASGCKRIDYSVQAESPPQTPLDSVKDEPLQIEEKPEPTPLTASTEKLSPNGNKYVPLDLPAPIVFTPNGPNPTWKPEQEDTIIPGEAGKFKIKDWNDDNKIVRRQLDVDEPETPTRVSAGPLPVKPDPEAPASPTPERPECEEQGFVSSSDYGAEEYTLGGMSDSTYEYLPKEFLLLGGQIEKYRAMYEQSMDVVKENLIFRPMLPKDDDILFSGKLSVYPNKLNEPPKHELEGENAHLTCFAGGMFGMGAKLFDRPDDLEIAKKLTEGCVWSYDMTPTGIMPEAFIAVPCESTKECHWNETKYWEVLDPGAEHRIESYKEQMKTYNKQMASASAWYEEELAAMTAPPTSAATEVLEAKATPTVTADLLDKRQLADLEDDTPDPASSAPAAASPVASHATEDRDSVMGGESEEGEGPPTKVQPSGAVGAEFSHTVPAFPVIYSPKPPLTHEEYVKNRIQEERLPSGVTSIKARSYILRPEAIESVWYMYRITGDNHWREAGWRMFEAVNKHTAALYGNSAIDDVTKLSPELNDEMESFWLAETLKYFYLLFADETVVSLDDWVLNTEAHPFRRPS
ncbi:seven-hairpin glycosidase [Corynespora cassiicola Philippines]|uniref:alpha-1,2-Mannosidase n=1 Tax=Corynespora cassiicola Philippines TaxID=1448308 RepID=A0A2T2NBP9_CORCC|nr:seven-hairpin glycosidase [Corynespora cassiicola Philippines]